MHWWVQTEALKALLARGRRHPQVQSTATASHDTGATCNDIFSTRDSAGRTRSAWTASPAGVGGSEPTSRRLISHARAMHGRTHRTMVVHSYFAWPHCVARRSSAETRLFVRRHGQRLHRFAFLGFTAAEQLTHNPHDRIVKASTTRSFSGMMPLSVMWMCSGQTSVQHLVMLHRPMSRSSLTSAGGRRCRAGASPGWRRGS